SYIKIYIFIFFFFFQAEDGIRDFHVTGVQTCALPIYVKNFVIEDVKSFKMGSPEDMGNFISAVITESSFDKLAKAIDDAKASNEAEIIVGGGYDKSKGWFIEPTVIVTTNPKYDTMERELFGPVLTVYVYEDDK